MKNTVILYYPAVDFKPFYPCYWAPLSILSVAAPLVGAGFEVILLDGNLGNEASDVRVLKEKYANCVCVGISAMIGGGQLRRGLKMASLVKMLDAKLPVIFGGPLGTVIPEILFEDENVDFVIRGQGEFPFTNLVQQIASNGSTDDIPGVAKKRQMNFGEPVIYDMNSLPEYPWHLLDVEKYVRQDRIIGKRVLNFVSSQGCPHHCGYCSEVSSYHCKWKAMAAQRMIKAVHGLVEKFNLDGIKFYDSNFFVNCKRVVEFSQGLIGKGVDIGWAASAHPKDIKRLSNDFALLKKSGLRRILIGAESGSQLSLDYIKKGCTTEDIINAAKICAMHNISATFTFIVGIPGTPDDVNATLRMALKLKRMSGDFDVTIHFYAPLPGTPLYEEARSQGYNPPNSLAGWSEYNYYSVQIPWLNKATEKKVRMFSDFYSDFLYPPSWFLAKLNSMPVAKVIYRALRSLAMLRFKLNFYHFPIERYWIESLLGKNMLKRSD